VKTEPGNSPIPLVTVLNDYLHGDWGFTGTRAGMTDFQSRMVRRILVRGQPAMFRHGGAWGADAEAHALWRITRSKTARANIWPSDEKRAALFRNQPHVSVESPMNPLTRNIIVVERSIFMIAAPNNEHEEQRSGTWQTIREALKRDRPVLILWPRSQRLTLYLEKKLHRVTYTPSYK
jgi:hypothetical protein